MPVRRLRAGLTSVGGQLELERTHPRARGLVGCFLPGGGNLANMTGLSPPLRPQSGVKWGANLEGPSTVNVGNDSRSMVIVYPNDPLALGTTGTLMWRGLLYSSPASGLLSGMNYGLPNASTEYSPYVTYSLECSSDGYVGFSYNSGGTLNPAYAYSPLPIATRSVAVTYVANSGPIAMYMDGLLVKTDTFNGVSGPSYAPGGNSFNVGGDGNGNLKRSMNGETNATFVWNRALSPAEIASAHRDPYAMLRPVKRMAARYGRIIRRPIMYVIS